MAILELTGELTVIFIMEAIRPGAWHGRHLRSDG